MNSNGGKFQAWIAALMSAWVVFVSTWLCFLTPGKSWPYLVAIALVCVAWALRLFASGKMAIDSPAQQELHKITQAIVLSAALLGMTATLALLSRLGVITDPGGELKARSAGMLMGVIVIAMGNGIPKQVSSARGLVVLRIAGWAFVLGGVGYALAWLALPLRYAGDVAIAALVAAMAYAALRIVIYRRGRNASVPPTSR